MMAEMSESRSERELDKVRQERDLYRRLLDIGSQDFFIATGVVLVTARLEIIVGDARNMDSKIAAVRSLLQANPPAEPSTIDARYADMLVVRALARETE